MKFFRFQSLLIGAFVFLLWACASYKKNIILTTPEDFKSAPITKEVLQAERNYVIQQNDLLQLEVYTNKGERIIDPNPDVSHSTANSSMNDERPEVNYMIDLNGVAKFPVIGATKMEGLTLRKAEEILETEFEKYFKDSFVILTFQNKRVILLGAVGGQVIPLHNQNMTLVEVIALAKGLPNDAIAESIKVVRKDKVFIVNLTTVEGFQNGNMIIEPGDIVYVEPLRRPFTEGLRDYAGLYSLFISTLSLIIVINSLKK